MRKNKHLKFWSMGVGMSASLLGILLVTSLSSFTTNTSNDYSLINKNNQNVVRANVTPQPLSSQTDLKITSSGIETGHISADEVIDDEGNYILTASNNSNNNAKVVKLNYQMQYLYDWTYNTTNYVTRQIVADTDDIGYYYALLVNNNVSITGTNDDTFSVSNPAIVVQLYDTGSSFEQKNIYNLGLPNFHINDVSGYSNVVANNVTVDVNDTDNVARNIWDHVYVQEAIQESDDNSKLSMIRTTTTPNSTAQDTETTDTNVYVNDTSKAVIYKMLSPDDKKDNSTTTQSSSYYMLKQLYLNNANNMVYLKDQTTNKKMILLFGGNAYQSFWFYDFEVQVTNNAATKYVSALLYANYDFDPMNAKNSEEVEYQTEPDISSSRVLKKYYTLPFLQKNKISNLAWYIGGAKTITLNNLENSNQSGSSYVLLAMMTPNVTDFNSQLIENASLEETKEISKGTYGTPEEVSYWNSNNITQSNDNDLTDTNISSLQTTNPQLKTGLTQKYNNKDVLIASSSINASYEVFSSNKTFGTQPSSFYYPFSAIQSYTIFPIMTTQIASLIAITPQSSENDFTSINEKIYLSTRDTLPSSGTDNIKKFALFNCFKNNNNTFNRFDFAREFFTIPSSWLKDKEAPSITSNNLQYVYSIGSDPAGMSRILLNTNPENADGYISDGWNNSASQKIIAFSPQLTSKVMKTDYGSYYQIAATLIIRGAIYSFTYNLVQPEVGLSYVPVANFTDRTKNSLSSSSSLINFKKLLSISYLDNNWLITYQDSSSKKYTTYLLTYIPEANVWSFSQDSRLSSDSDTLSKAFVSLNNNFILIDGNKKVKLLSNFSQTPLEFNDSSSINNNKEIWGTVSPVDQQYLIDNNLLSKTPSEIASDQDLLNQLVNYSGGWSVNTLTGEPTEKPMIINLEVGKSSISFDIAIKFINGIYYTSSSINSVSYQNVVQNPLLDTPSFNYDGFATLAPWVMPAIIGGTVFLIIVFIMIGVLVTLSLHKNKKMMQKGFASSNKKIDTLTTAVGSVYQKILTQTKNNKQPQMLKAAAKPKPGATPAPKPAASPASKPSAPSAAPKKPA